MTEGVPVTGKDGGGAAGRRSPAAAGAAPQPRSAAVLAGTPLPPPSGRRSPDQRPLDQALSPEAAARVAAGLAANTTRAYTRHWATFTRWCELTGRTPLPATRETLAEYVHHLAGETTTQYGGPPAPSTVDTMLSCVQAAHKLAGLDCDARLARTALRAYRRERAGHPDPALRYRRRRAPEIDIAALRRMIEAIAEAVAAGELDPLRAERDQLILVLGFAMMGRRSEVAALDIEDLDFSERGLTVTIRRSKTDQQAAGAEVFLKRGRHARTCPVELARTWLGTLAGHGITGGPLLRGIDRHGNLAGAGRFAGRGTGRIDDETLNTIVRDAAVRAGLDHAAAHTFHGLRAGGATSAAEAGAAPSTIQQHGRWNSLSMVFVYWRRGTAWTNNALDGVGL
ncbi:tyrosine-type recombinase/integrase [Actinomadura sp. LD22]|uniref:Tyrosine-type recombinase/integrase n=1 Tax=Actinomadura physcomitrii TaxID=2650748 RepID=A0A6I4MUG6_9ACTN|nr:tyrosine-type recombinase/integrase [Actinomadura physcomitrii]MWA05946.1 tyrosine-type recombinase/integrase [Actinomadura physcomitrii]